MSTVFDGVGTIPRQPVVPDPLPPTFNELWARVEALEKRNAELEKRLDEIVTQQKR